MGIGSGSTIVYAVQRLAERVKEENLVIRYEFLRIILNFLDNFQMCPHLLPGQTVDSVSWTGSDRSGERVSH